MTVSGPGRGDYRLQSYKTIGEDDEIRRNHERIGDLAHPE